MTPSDTVGVLLMPMLGSDADTAGSSSVPELSTEVGIFVSEHHVLVPEVVELRHVGQRAGIAS